MTNKKTNKPLFSVTKKDLEIQHIKASGPGGQNVNKRNTAVRITHPPSVASVIFRTHRSQEQNKKEALKKLSETPEFMKWVRIETARILGKEDIIKKAVERAMNKNNIKIEIKEEGKWIEYKEGYRGDE